MVEGRVSLVSGSFLVTGRISFLEGVEYQREGIQRGVGYPVGIPYPHLPREGSFRGRYASCWKSVNMRSIPNKLEKFKYSSALPELYYYCSVLIFGLNVLVISLCFQRFILTEHHSKTQSEFPDLLDKCRIECTSCRL